MRRKTGLILAALALPACTAPPFLPSPPIATIGLADAMLQTVDALAATRAEAARHGLRACGAEAVFHVMVAPGQSATQLALAPHDGEEAAQSGTVTLRLAAESCDAPEPAPRARR